MHEKIKYINHLGEIIEFGSGDYFLNESELHDYSWSYSSDNDVMADFRRAVTSKSLPIVISGKNNIELKNRFFAIVETDVLSGHKGALWYGNYYYSCYVIQSKKSNYINVDGSLTVNLTVATDTPYWVKEITTQFRSGGSADGLSYTKQYAYRYTDYNTRYTVTNNTLAAAPFRMVIYGPCENPEIWIGSQRYRINITLAEGEFIELTAFEKSKTVVKTDASGTQTNCFNAREKTIDVFEPIPTGTFEVAWDGSFAFDLIVCDRRSEPPWI